MIIDTEQLREKLKDKIYERKVLHSGSLICYEEKEEIIKYLYYLERIEQLFKEYFREMNDEK